MWFVDFDVLDLAFFGDPETIGASRRV